MTLLDEVRRLNNLPGRWVTEKQKRIAGNISNDLREYPDDETCILECKQKNGDPFFINLNEELIRKNVSSNQNPWASYGLVYYYKQPQQGEIFFREEITYCDKPGILDSIFDVVSQEMDVIKKIRCPACQNRVYNGYHFKKAIQLSHRPVLIQCPNCDVVI
ncbi:hypothetical protein [Paenibacillus campinasensis]|nr:hypothetical protein [Paenibacillus campinasensis]